MRFKDAANPNPGPGSYNAGHTLSSSIERTKGGKFGIDRKKDMVMRNSVGEFAIILKDTLSFLINKSIFSQASELLESS